MGISEFLFTQPLGGFFVGLFVGLFILLVLLYVAHCWWRQSGYGQ